MKRQSKDSREGEYRSWVPRWEEEAVDLLAIGVLGKSLISYTGRRSALGGNRRSSKLLLRFEDNFLPEAAVVGKNDAHAMLQEYRGLAPPGFWHNWDKRELPWPDL